MKWLGLPIGALLLTGCIATANPGPVASLPPDEAKALSVCSALADDDGYGQMESVNIMASAANTVFNAVRFGHLSTYGVTSIAQRSAGKAIRSQARKDQSIRLCMRKSGYPYY